VFVPEREEAVLTCAIDGIPYPTVRFMKDWRPLTDTSRLVVSRSQEYPEVWTLKIHDAIASDSGSYMCVAENVAGKVFSTCRVTVDGQYFLLFSGLFFGGFLWVGGCGEDVSFY
jgi:hypothetical protein